MKKMILLIVLVFALTSCLDDFLNIEPKSNTYSTVYWQNETEANAGLVSIYADIQTCLRNTAGLTYIGWYEVRSDNCFGNPSSSYGYPYSTVNQNILTNTNPCANWNTWYKAIGSANIALYNIPKIEKLSTTTKNQLLAEAHFLRAYCYFNIVKIWGNAPIVLKPVFTFADVTKPSCDSIQLIMDSVILSDIHMADSLVYISKQNLYRFDAGTLYAMATDVAMWNHDYESALTYSQKLYNLNLYTLVSGTDFNKVVSTATTTENIWSLKWSYINNGYNPIVQNLTTQYVLVAKPVKDLWASQVWRKDLRRYQTIDTTVVYASNHLTSINNSAAMWKYQPVTRLVTNKNEKYIPLYRLADIILLRAEALNKSGRYSDALTELNKIRTRAGLTARAETDYAVSTDKMYDIESDILQERQFELLGEGKRWFDLVRTGRVVTVMGKHFDYLSSYGGTNVIRFTNDKVAWQVYWPIYQNNIIENPNLTQIGEY